jgi:hypothetical protein
MAGPPPLRPETGPRLQVTTIESRTALAAGTGMEFHPARRIPRLLTSLPPPLSA